MTILLSSLFLIAGAAICLIAALGVLRLPDFFLRMHAATKAGVAGAGLVLIGVAFAEPSFGMWVKITIAIAFLLLTTPIAGHLLARAGYVAGVPLWGGTYQNDLPGELPRGEFESRAPHSRHVAGAARPLSQAGSVLVTLTSGRGGEAAMQVAIDIAVTTNSPLLALAIIDTKMLNNVGPVPLGGNYYAAQLRRSQVEKARGVLASVVQEFERRAQEAGVLFSIAMEEGDPIKILRSRGKETSTILVSRDGWFDHGIDGGRSDPLAYLVRGGIYPLIGAAARPAIVRSVTFIHDGTSHSDRTLEWFLARDPWPSAVVHLVPDASIRQSEIQGATDRAIDALGPRIANTGDTLDLTRSEVVIFGNEGHDGWMNLVRASSRPRLEDVPVVVFG